MDNTEKAYQSKCNTGEGENKLTATGKGLKQHIFCKMI